MLANKGAFVDPKIVTAAIKSKIPFLCWQKVHRRWLSSMEAELDEWADSVKNEYVFMTPCYMSTLH